MVFADVFGDGLSHRVQVRNGEAVWPCLGHGRYGQRRLLAGAPQFGAAMSATRVYFADVDGSGAADIVYAAVDHLLVFRNQSGNGYSAPLRVPLPLRLSPTDQISFSDIRGNGTTAIVITRVSPEVEHWACDLCADPVAPESGGKPYLLASTDNGLGATTTLRYASSTRFYLADKRAGLPGPRACPSPCRWSRRCAAPMRSPRCHSRGATPIATATSIRWRGCSVASAWWRALGRAGLCALRRHAGRQLADGARGRRAARATDANPDLVLPGRL